MEWPGQQLFAAVSREETHASVSRSNEICTLWAKIETIYLSITEQGSNHTELVYLPRDAIVGFEVSGLAWVSDTRIAVHGTYNGLKEQAHVYDLETESWLTGAPSN